MTFICLMKFWILRNIYTNDDDEMINFYSNSAPLKMYNTEPWWISVQLWNHQLLTVFQLIWSDQNCGPSSTLLLSTSVEASQTRLGSLVHSAAWKIQREGKNPLDIIQVLSLSSKSLPLYQTLWVVFFAEKPWWKILSFKLLVLQNFEIGKKEIV